jgi:hypothetical protein
MPPVSGLRPGGLPEQMSAGVRRSPQHTPKRAVYTALFPLTKGRNEYLVKRQSDARLEERTLNDR